MTTLRLLATLAAVALVVSASPTSVGTPLATEDASAAPETSTTAPAQPKPSTTTTTTTTTAPPEVTSAQAIPEGGVTPAAAIVVTPADEDEKPDDLSDVPEPVSKDSEGPEVYSLHIRSDVKFRYSTTLVTSRVVNRGTKAAEVSFQFVLPEKAFISGFLMEVKGKVYKAYVKEKEEANKVYQAAVEQGHTAAQVAVSARDSNLFAVSVNVEPQTKMNFNLTYEELLTRRLGLYDHIIHLFTSDKVIRDMKVEVSIDEPQNITTVKVPEPAEDNEVGDDGPSEELVKITRPTPNSALVTYAPSLEQQKKLLEKKKNESSVHTNIPEETSTQRLRVQYDVDHHSASGDVLLRDGYFVHFFAPAENSVEESRKRHKHVIFVLDTSGSMWGRKIQQLQEAMALILDSLNDKGDYFSIVQFSDSVKEWSPLTRESEESQGIHLVTSQNIEKAKKYIKTMEAYGGTNIAAALRLGLQIAARGLSGDPFRRTLEEQSNSSPLPQPLVIFLTDGEPTTGETRLSKILAGTRAMNTEARAPIFSLAFGNDADFRFVRKLSLQNHAFARRIYEAADATLQLESFFQEVSSPLLNNVTFSYINPKVDQSSLTESTFHTYFAGTEVVVAGRVKDMTVSEDDLGTTVSSSSSSASMSVSSKSTNSEPDAKAPTTKAPTPLEPLPLTGNEETEKPPSSAGAPSSELATAGSPPSLLHDILIHPKFPPPRTPEQEIRKPEPGSLERLWAYLTIRQLLDKDLADEEEKDPWEPTTPAPPVDNTTANTLAVIGGIIGKEPVPPTPKQKALQLALQYGFVTPLTSLVVVKPPKKGVDSTKPVSGTVTDPLLEGKEKAPGYGQFIQNKIVPVAAYGQSRPQMASFGGGYGGLSTTTSFGQAGAPGFAGSPIFGLSGPPSPIGYPGQPLSGYAPPSGPGTPGLPGMLARPGIPRPPPSFVSTHVPSGDISLQESEVPDSLDSALGEELYEENEEEKDEEVATTTSESTTGKHLTIEDIGWYDEHLTSEGQLNITQPGVADELYTVDNRTWRENETFGSCQTPNNQEGYCRHLSTCVQSEFVNNYTKFTEYFCPIDKMVGVCCPNTYGPVPEKEKTTIEAEAMTDDAIKEKPDTNVPQVTADITTEEKITT